MDQNGILLSYFQEFEAAQKALRILGRNGFRRRILLQSSPEGKIFRRDPARRIWVALMIVGGSAISLAAVMLSIFGNFFLFSSTPTWNHLITTLLGFGLGAGLGSLIAAIFFPAVTKNVIEHQENWLRTEELLLILQAPLLSLTSAVQILRDSIESEISIFALHPPREFPEVPILQKLSALALPQIRAHAVQLSKEHQVDLTGNSNQVLLNQLENARQTIHAICGDLSEAVRLEQNMSPVAEWILDNEYLIESHGRDVQINLPKTFYRELPILI